MYLLDGENTNILICKIMIEFPEFTGICLAVTLTVFFCFIFKAVSQRLSPSTVLHSNCCEALTWASNPLPLSYTNKTHERHKQINKGHEGVSSQMVFSLCVSVGRSPNEREPEQGI